MQFQAEETSSTKTEKTSVTRTHQSESSSSSKSTTTQKQATFRPVLLDNIPLPSTGGQVVGRYLFMKNRYRQTP